MPTMNARQILEQIDADEIAERLAEIEDESSALRVLLRVARRFIGVGGRGPRTSRRTSSGARRPEKP